MYMYQQHIALPISYTANTDRLQHATLISNTMNLKLITCILNGKTIAHTHCVTLRVWSM